MTDIHPLILSQMISDRTESRSDFLLLDVRRPNEQEICLIPGTDHLIPHDEINERLEEVLPWKDKTIVVYCRIGERSLIAEKFLTSKGFADVRNLQGGILEYIRTVDSSLPDY